MPQNMSNTNSAHSNDSSPTGRVSRTRTASHARPVTSTERAIAAFAAGLIDGVPRDPWPDVLPGLPPPPRLSHYSGKYRYIAAGESTPRTWYDPICSVCEQRHPGRVRTDGVEYIEFNEVCPLTALSDTQGKPPTQAQPQPQPQPQPARPPFRRQWYHEARLSGVTLVVAILVAAVLAALAVSVLLALASTWAPTLF